MKISAEQWARMVDAIMQRPDEDLAEFVKQWPVAIQEPGISARLQRWAIEGKQELFERAFKRGRGENADAYERKKEILIIQDRVDRLRDQGISVTEAFETVGKCLPLTKVSVSADSVRKLYYKKNVTTAVMRETDSEIIVTAYPARVDGVFLNGIPTPLYGQWELRIPKK